MDETLFKFLIMGMGVFITFCRVILFLMGWNI